MIVRMFFACPQKILQTLVVEEGYKFIGVMDDHTSQLNLETSDGIRHAPTRETYEVYLMKLSFFLEVLYVKGVDIPKDLFTDANISKFLAILGPAHQFKPHILKATVAGLGMMIEFYGLPKILEDFKHWMFTTRAIKVKLIFACPSVILYDFYSFQEMEDGSQDESVLCIIVFIVFSRGCPPNI